MSPAAMAEGIKWGWEHFAEYVEVLERLPKGINYATNIGHSALRTWVMGERAFTEDATDDDLEAMRRELRSALECGAIGFTTSRSSNHETSDDRPVASRRASWHEISSLVGVMSEERAGVFELALEVACRSDDPDVRGEFWSRVENLAVESGVPFTFGVTPFREDGADWRSMLDSIDAATASGGQMFGQSRSRAVSVIFSFETSLPFDSIPEWKEIRSRSLADQARLLQEPDVRKRLIQAVHVGNPGRSIGAELRSADFDAIKVMTSAMPPFESVAELARQRNVDPVELVIDLGLASNFKQLFTQALSLNDSAALETIMKHPKSVMTFSDAGAHVTQIADASIQTHLLAHWVREVEAFTLEEAIRMITFAPAHVWGFHDRGILLPGMTADVNIIDPERVAPQMPMLVADFPAGAKRLEQKATGIEATIIGGEIFLEHGVLTGALPGQLLRGPLAHHA